MGFLLVDAVLRHGYDALYGRSQKVGLAVWGMASFTTDMRNRQVTGETPAGILKKRLARGEITALQFEKLNQTIQKSKGNV